MLSSSKSFFEGDSKSKRGKLDLPKIHYMEGLFLPKIRITLPTVFSRLLFTCFVLLEPSFFTEGVGGTLRGGYEGSVLAMARGNTAQQVSRAGAGSAGREQGSFSSPAGLPRRMAGWPSARPTGILPWRHLFLGRSILLLNFPAPQALPL